MFYSRRDKLLEVADTVTSCAHKSNRLLLLKPTITDTSVSSLWNIYTMSRCVLYYPVVLHQTFNLQ